jgi:hypothetical protein
MNRIRTQRVLIAGLATLLVFILIEFLLEGVLIGAILPGKLYEIYASTGAGRWNWSNQVINIGVALFNCLMMIWLYAALRPMFGVGPRSALITCGFVFAFFLAIEINNVNMGNIPLRVAVVDLSTLLIELPIALIAGAHVYEAG